MKNGEQIGGSIRDGLMGPTTFAPQSSTPIQVYGSSLTPRIRSAEGEVIEQQTVTKVNMARNNSNHEAEMLRLEVEREEHETEQKELRDWMDPSKLRAEIQYLQRSVKRLQKSLSALQKDHE